jgi:hypothetical protein
MMLSLLATLSMRMRLSGVVQFRLLLLRRCRAAAASVRFRQAMKVDNREAGS